MALKGNLREFSITQLLNLINLARKTGTLIVEGPNDAVWVFFREGRLAYAQARQDDHNLIEILHKANRLTAAQYRAIKGRADSLSDLELGLLLINGFYLSRSEILKSLQAHFTEILNRLFTWEEGSFRFESGLFPPDGKITVQVGLANIIVEGTRRLREWEYLQDEIPSLEMALKFTDLPGANIRNINLSVEEWRVVSYINPKNTLRQIARATHLNDLEIRRIVYGLLQAGLIEIIRPDGGSQPPPPRKRLAFPSLRSSVEDQKSLIYRIIHRIRSL